MHAPGHRSLFETPIASHHLLRAHAQAVRTYRAEGRHRIGLVVNLEPKYPASDDAADRASDVAVAAGLTLANMELLGLPFTPLYLLIAALYDLTRHHPDPLVPHDRVVPVPERRDPN